MNGYYHYEIVMPSHLEEGKKYATIFALHGKGSNEQDLLNLLAPLKEQFIIISIRGNMPMGFGFQYYELKSLGNPVREMFDEAMKQLETFIMDATEKYPVDAQQRFLLGFSQGAILSSSLALRMGDKLKGIVALSGYIPDFVKYEYELKSIQDVAIFVSHGQYDSVFPIAIGHETANYLKEKANEVAFHTYPTDHGVSAENARDIMNWLLEQKQ